MGAAVLVDGAASDGAGGLAAALDQLSRGIDAVAAVPFTGLSLAEQATGAAAMVRLRARLEAVEAAAVQAFDTGGEWALDGHRSAAAALAHRCRLSRAEARRRVRFARRLREAPVVAAALAAGDLTTDHAQVLMAARRPEVTAQFARDEAVLVDQGRSLSFAEFRIAVRYWSDRADPDGAQRRAERIAQTSRAYVSRSFDDRVRVDAWLDPIGGTAVLTAVERIEDELFRAAKPKPATGRPPRSPTWPAPPANGGLTPSSNSPCEPPAPHPTPSGPCPWST